MAAHPTLERIVKIKIEEIDQLKLQIIDNVDQVEKVTKSGQSWIDSQGSVDSYRDLNVQLDSAINLLCEIVDKINTSPEPEAKAATMLPPTPFPGPSSDELLRRIDALEHKGKTIYNRQCSTDETVGQMDKKIKSLEDRQDQCDDRLSQLKKEQENDRIAMKEHQPDVYKVLVCAEGSKTEAAPVLAKVPSHGFAASMPADGKRVSLCKDQRVTCFTNVTFNPGGHYDPVTCTYTVPVTGWYRIKLSHTQSGRAWRDSMTLRVMWLQRQSEQSGDGQSQKVFVGCQTLGCDHEKGVKLQAAEEKVVDLSVGDELYVELYDCYETTGSNCIVICCHAKSTRALLPPTSFSCELLECL